MKERIINLRNLGYSYNKISEELNVSKSTVAYHLRKEELNIPINGIPYKYDENIIEQINKLNDGTLTKKEISDVLNVSYNTVKKYTEKRIKLSTEDKKNRMYLKNKNWRILTKIKCLTYLGGKCSKCGYDKCLGALDLHHKDMIEKEFSISGGNLKSFEKLIPELKKCEILCANCHREHHFPHLIGLL